VFVGLIVYSVLKEHGHRFSTFFFILYENSDHKTKCPYHMTSQRVIQISNSLLCKQGSLTYITMCIQCGLDALLNLQFESISEVC
jgi:hypothetical protein